MATHAHSYNSASGADQLPLSERAIELNSAGFRKSIDERTFSDFNIDGSEKDWRQDAVEASGGSGYHGDQKKKDDIENLRDAAEIASEALDQARQEIMRFGDGFEFTREEFEEANDSIIEEIENDPVKYAEEEGVSLAQAMAILAVSKDAKKNGFDEDAMRARHGDDAVDGYQDRIKDKVNADRGLKNEADLQLKNENQNTKSIAELTKEEQTAKVEMDNSFSDDLGFDDLEDNPTSLAKSISNEESTVASMKGHFDQAVIAVNKVEIPTPSVAPTRESTNIMDNAIG